MNKQMHIRKAANLSIIEKPKMPMNAAMHKKQNTLTDSSIFKYLTSPRLSKNKYKIPSSRLEVTREFNRLGAELDEGPSVQATQV